MARIISWLKSHWQVVVILILGYLVLRGGSVAPLTGVAPRESPAYKSSLPEASLPGSSSALNYGASQEAAPTPEVKDRLVIKNSTLSLLASKVKEVQEAVIKKAEAIGGYMVESQISAPEGIESATVSVRVPSIKLDEALIYFRNLAVRVVDEHLVGTDVTDEYVDLQARLETLNKTKAKFEEIMAKATEIQDILQVQRELISLQDQIDSLKGQQLYLEKSAQMAKVTIYISADELALPYAPAQPWRPNVIFKTAVRSLIGTVRSILTAGIWLAVFAVIWAPALVIVILVRRRLRKT